jgi:hypothetical protein
MKIYGGPPVGVWRKKGDMKYATIDGVNRDALIDLWFSLKAEGNDREASLLIHPRDRPSVVSLYHEMCERDPRAKPPLFDDPD